MVGKPYLAVVAAVEAHQVVGIVIQAEAQGQRPQELTRRAKAPPVKGHHEVPEARQHGLRQPHIGLELELLAADLVRLLLLLFAGSVLVRGRSGEERGREAGKKPKKKTRAISLSLYLTL